MQPVFRLIPDHRLGAVDDPGGHLLAAVRRQAVHEEGVRPGQGHHGLVDDIAGKGAQTGLLFGLLAHAGPDVGDHQVRPGHRRAGIAQQDAALAGGGEEPGVGVEALWTGEAQLKIEQRRGLQIGLAHVVAVAHPDDGAAADVAAVLEPGLHVRQQLAGVEVVGEGVDHRHTRMGGELLDDGMGEGADHDHVHHPRQDPGAVGDGLAAAELGVPGGEEDGMAAELGHAGLEGDPGAG